MFLLYGETFRGKVDQVPGRYYIATRFFHMFGFPLFPDRSYLVVAGSETTNGWESDPLEVGSWRLTMAGGLQKRGGVIGVRIRFRWKSALFAWFRALIVLVAVGYTFFECSVLSSLARPEAGPGARHEYLVRYGGAMLGLLVLFCASFWVTRANAVRARQIQELAARMGLDDFRRPD